MGAYPQGIDDVVTGFVEALGAAGYGGYALPDIMAAKRTHLIHMTPLALKAITDGKGNPETFLERTFAEARACFEANGLSIEPDEPYLARAQRDNWRNRPQVDEVRDNLGSQWQSLKRDLETDFLNGEVVVLGRRKGVPTPFNSVLQRVAHEMARDGTLPGCFTAEGLYELARASAPLT